jgi:hypothetical protein
MNATYKTIDKKRDKKITKKTQTKNTTNDTLQLNKRQHKSKQKSVLEVVSLGTLMKSRGQCESKKIKKFVGS